ncbi:protein PLASTID MOVEMENT IMPAIRED 2-like [Curcuma longa]|uniref:protein PLASTID MOVEMENT IMPAIRED 2-like n=1 Tax=Curcuma longa TaxID=136217 RepID=UPI003D9E9FBF
MAARQSQSTQGVRLVEYSDKLQVSEKTDEQHKSQLRRPPPQEELVMTKHELSRLKLEMASAKKAKANAEKEAEASTSRAMQLLESVEQLRRQIEASDDEHMLVVLARIEAEREHDEIESQRAAVADKFAQRIAAVKSTIKDLNQEVRQQQELESELAITNLAIAALQTELGSIRSHKLQEETELSEAKQELASSKEEAFHFMNAMDFIRKEMVQISAETNRLKGLEQRAESKVVRLNSELLKAKTKLEALTAGHEKMSTSSSSLSAEIQRFRAETEAAEKERERIREESNGIRGQMDKIESEIEEKSLASVRTLRAAKASEATALKKLKNGVERAVKTRAFLLQFGSTISISRIEHEYLVRRGRAARAVAEKKVAAAAAWVAAVVDRARKAAAEAELVERKNRELRDAEAPEIYQAQRAAFARKSLEEEMNTIITEQEQEPHSSEEEDEIKEDSDEPERIKQNKSRSGTKLRRIPSSPAAWHVRSPLVVINKRKKAMPKLVTFLKDRRR